MAKIHTEEPTNEHISNIGLSEPSWKHSTVHTCEEQGFGLKRKDTLMLL